MTHQRVAIPVNGHMFFMPHGLPISGAQKLGAKNWTQTLFSLKLFGHFRDIPAKTRDIPPKSLISLASSGISNFLAPTPSRGRPLPHRKIQTDSAVWVCALFSCLRSMAKKFGGKVLAKFGWSFWPFLLQNHILSCVVPSDASGMSLECSFELWHSQSLLLTETSCTCPVPSRHTSTPLDHTCQLASPLTDALPLNICARFSSGALQPELVNE